MNRPLKVIFCVVLLALTSACSVAPLSNLYTARSIGKGVWSFSGGFLSNASGGPGSGVPAFKIDYGLYDKLDVGMHYELVNTGFVAKYSFINGKDGWSWAGVLSAGSADGGGYWYMGTVASYKFAFFEPYASVRFNRVTRGTTNFSVTSIGTWTTPSTTFDYLYFTLGTGMWPTEKFGFLIEYNFFGTLNTSTTFPAPAYLSGAVVYRM